MKNMKLSLTRELKTEMEPAQQKRIGEELHPDEGVRETRQILLSFWLCG